MCHGCVDYRSSLQPMEVTSEPSSVTLEPTLMQQNSVLSSMLTHDPTPTGELAYNTDDDYFAHPQILCLKTSWRRMEVTAMCHLLAVLSQSAVEKSPFLLTIPAMPTRNKRSPRINNSFPETFTLLDTRHMCTTNNKTVSSI